MPRIKLGVNIDHVATLRQQRRGALPDPIQAALEAQAGGANGIVIHLREDRRHAQMDDIARLARAVDARELRIPWSLEMAATEEMHAIAREWASRICLVPERRQELTTEGGLDVVSKAASLGAYCRQFGTQMQISLFVDPEEAQVQAAKTVGAGTIELHTGAYAAAKDEPARKRELERLRKAARVAMDLGLHVHAGHGLDYDNTGPIAQLPGVEELNIGFAIIGRAVFVGLRTAVKEMKELIACAE